MAVETRITASQDNPAPVKATQADTPPSSAKTGGGTTARTRRAFRILEG